MEFRNSTALNDERLHTLFVRHTIPYRHDRLRVSVRYSRGADFSGTCYYREGQIFVNVGKHVSFPYLMGTNIARAQSNRTHWWRETYHISLADAYQLALFVYLHELYHHLVKKAGRSPRRKESRCDRFAARALVDYHACQVTDSHGRAVPREAWDFQDLDKLVAKAPRDATPAPSPPPRPRPLPPRLLDIPITYGRFGGLTPTPPAAP